MLNDFFAECDEHLTHIRQDLILLEPSIGKAQVELAVVQDLFRGFHSLKGISAIVGLRAAESLAHGTEDYLRELSRSKISLSSHGLDLLMSSAQKLEQIVNAFRTGQAIPDSASLLEQLHEISGSSNGTNHGRNAASGARSTSVPEAAPVVSSSLMDEARSRGLVLWKIKFTPSKELDQKGININSVRAKLSSVGEILKAVPMVRGEGVVVFEFVVGMKETPADITRWENEGLVAELFEQAGEAESEPVPTADLASAMEAHNPFLAPTHVVRVDLNRLDDLMRIVGEMVIQRSRFDEQIERSRRERQVLDLQRLQEVNTGLARSLRALRDGVMRVRLVSVAEIFARMPFVVRDLARDSNKKVRLTLEGQQTEIDKYLIEQLKDPLLHLVRNSFSHGVETPEERRAAGKPEEATILLKASTSGDSVILITGDDGRGIDREAVLRQAIKAGLTTAESLDNNELLRILCSPGFSTRADADRAAGRGVGMAVVWNKIKELGGSLTLETERNRGSKFIIRLPLTLAIAEMLIVSAAAQTCAVPQSFVSEVLQVTEDEVRRVNGVEVIQYREGILPIIRLASFFGLRAQASARLSVLVLVSDRGSSGLLVDRIHGQKEVVVQALRDPLVQVPGVAGATELGNGRPVLILDGGALTSGAIRPHVAEEKTISNEKADHGY